MTGTRQADLARLRTDLATMHSAAGLEQPFGREVVRFWFVVAAGSAVAAAAVAFGSAVQQLLAFALLAVAAAGLLVRVLFFAGRATEERRERPALWREFRQIGLMKLVAALIAAFLAVQARLGAPLLYIGASALFFLGAGVLVYASSSRTRRFGVGIAVPFMALGAMLPLLPTGRMLLLATMLCFTAAALGSGAILAWQLRSERGN